MNLGYLKNKARLENRSLLQIIREIQITEHNNPCYATNNYGCKEINCCWRKGCLGISARHIVEVGSNKDDYG